MTRKTKGKKIKKQRYFFAQKNNGKIQQKNQRKIKG